MKFKYYFFFTLIFLAVVGIAVYGVNDQSLEYKIPFSTSVINLPVAIWIVLIVSIFFIATILFFAGDWVVGGINKYKQNKDYEALLAQIKQQMLGADSQNIQFNTQHYRSLSKIIKKFDLVPILKSQPCDNPKINKVFESFNQIKNNMVVNVNDLNQNSPMGIQNIKNKIDSDSKFAHKVLDGQYSNEIKNYALRATNCEQIQKYVDSITLEKESINLFIQSLLSKTLKIENKDISKVFVKSNFSTRDYLDFAKATKSVLEPDEWIKLFEIIADNDNKAELSYFYVLLELSMIEKAKERREMHTKDEFNIVDIYMDLRNSGKTYPIDTFFNLN